MTFGGVVSGHRLNYKIVGQLQVVAIRHQSTTTKVVGAALVGDDMGVLAFQQFDGRRVKMVEMFVGDEDIIRFGHGGIVDGFIAKFGQNCVPVL